MKPRCAVCGRPYHRYSTSDPQHKWDGVACVNGLLHEIEAYREMLDKVVDSGVPDALSDEVIDVLNRFNTTERADE